MINIRFCKKCGKGYDIYTDYELCPECRGEDNLEKHEELEE